MKRSCLLVTGASGFVGSRVLALAAQRFQRVLALSRSEIAELPAGAEAVRGDLLGDRKSVV